jgi:hypothetical protein
MTLHVMRSSPRDSLVTSTAMSSGRSATPMSLSSATPMKNKKCARRIPTSTTSTVDADEDLKGIQDDNSDDLAPDQEKDNGGSSGDKAGSP